MSEPARGSHLTDKVAAVGPDILHILEQNLSDAQLLAWFSGHSPDHIREYLRKAAKLLAGLPPASFLVNPSPKPLLPEAARLAKNGEIQPKLILFTDGASRGNPGEAGAGLVISDASGRELFAGGKYLGQCTNNMAEYQALLLGLREVRRLGASEVAIYLDSELIVRQLQGRYRVKDAKLIPLYEQARKLLAGFVTWQVRHVPRAQNARADELSNQAIDERL